MKSEKWKYSPKIKESRKKSSRHLSKSVKQKQKGKYINDEAAHIF